MKYFVTALSMIVLFAACKQKTPVVTPTRADMLRQGKWKVSSGKLTAKIASGKDTVVDYYNFCTPTCNQDDYLVFDSLFHGSIHSGNNKCNPGDPDYTSFTWRLTNNDNNIDLLNGFTNVYGFWDTVKLQFDADHPDGHFVLKLGPMALPNMDISNAAITNFSQSSFTIAYTYRFWYFDTTNSHEVAPNVYWDTLRYSVTYTNF